MATGNSQYESKTVAQLYRIMGSGDTAELLAEQPQIDETYDIPDAGGISIDRRTVYIDRTFAAAVRSGQVAVAGMTADQIIRAIAIHELTEKSILDGDNAVDVYAAAHEFATVHEHLYVAMVGTDPEAYEAALAAPVAQAEAQIPQRVPMDLWVGPYLDNPDDNDLRILAILMAANVPDALKYSKRELHYGVGEEECQTCRFFAADRDQSGGALGLCVYLCGLVRWDRHCDYWTPMDGSGDADGAYSSNPRDRSAVVLPFRRAAE